MDETHKPCHRGGADLADRIAAEHAGIVEETYTVSAAAAFA